MFVTKRLFLNLSYLNLTKDTARAYRSSPRINAGIGRRKQLLNDDDNEIIDLEDYDYDLEADFSNVGNSYEAHRKEIISEKQREQFLIVRRKYFKKNSPNFLTWSDREQIQHLHRTDPEQWTVEKLSEGFPALPEVIAKILKGSWTKHSVKKVENYDKSVQENWELFKQKKLNLDHELSEHLNKFTKRSSNDTKSFGTIKSTNAMINKDRVDMKIGNEFSNIITSYERLKKSKSRGKEENINENKTSMQKNVKGDTYLLDNGRSRNSTHITLRFLEDKISQKSMSGQPLSEDELILQDITRKSNEVNINKSVPKDLPAVYKATTTKIVSVKKKLDDYLLEYPEKIFIPKNIRKLGCTYKLNDCYYDDDGLFLYRVPGMYK
ncbi:hypothetical protein FQA39_LY08745 [Lamprigera yunnana]|nr:hypothetical protein FQA39_LY08745 [Lamprigera yunnana]